MNSNSSFSEELRRRLEQCRLSDGSAVPSIAHRATHVHSDYIPPPRSPMKQTVFPVLERFGAPAISTTVPNRLNLTLTLKRGMGPLAGPLQTLPVGSFENQSKHYAKCIQYTAEDRKNTWSGEPIDGDSGHLNKELFRKTFRVPFSNPTRVVEFERTQATKNLPGVALAEIASNRICTLMPYEHVLQNIDPSIQAICFSIPIAPFRPLKASIQIRCECEGGTITRYQLANAIAHALHNHIKSLQKERSPTTGEMVHSPAEVHELTVKFHSYRLVSLQMDTTGTQFHPEIVAFAPFGY